MLKRSVMMTGVVVVIWVISGLVGFAAIPSQSLYPLTVGSKWTFEAGQHQLIEEVTKLEMIDGEQCARVETRVNGQVVAFEHLAARADGIYRVTVSGERVVPPLCFLKYDTAAGMPWNVASRVNGVMISGQFASGKTQVSVPAGEFQSVAVRGTKFESEAGSLEFTYYFVPGIGKVKQVISARGRSAELVLKQYHVAP